MGRKSVIIVGVPGSPYSRKMLALLRYRRIPYRWIVRGAREDNDFPKAAVDLLPVLLFDSNGGEREAHIDSTPLNRRLEKDYSDPEHSSRSVIPGDRGLEFIDALLEDFADEWMTKAMFHYRWSFEADIAKAKSILPRWSRVDADEELMQQMGEAFGRRQIERRAVVGINEDSGPVIEGSYGRVLEALDHALRRAPYLMGLRPGASDFAVYGQLTQLVTFDPSAAAVSLRVAPRVCAWVEIMEDRSGVEPEEDGWATRQETEEHLAPLLTELGRCYTPFLLANSKGVQDGDDEATITVGDATWTQQPFPYQAKCLAVLREGYQSLDEGDRAWVDGLLSAGGADRLFSDTN